MKIEIVGKEAEVATQELVNLEVIESSYETRDEAQKEGVLTTIATIALLAEVSRSRKNSTAKLASLTSLIRWLS